MCCIRNFKDATSSYRRYTGAIKTIDAPDDMTLVVTTTAPYPALLNELSALSFLSAKASGHPHKIKFDATTFGIMQCPATTGFNTGDGLRGKPSCPG